MSWMQQLNQVYDNNSSQVGRFEEKRKQRITLLPVSHVMQSAQIEILVTPAGDFKNAKVIDKENARTIVPATPASSNRSNTSAPHYIHDKLAYVAGDYVKYGGDSKYKEHYNDYLKQMQEWAQLDHAPRKIQAIYSYIAKGKVIEDLVIEKILPINEDHIIIDKWKSKEDKPDIYKVSTNGALSAFVRFDVLHDFPDDPVVWEDLNLFDSFINYLQTIFDQEKGLCYITGSYTNLTTQHGSRIRHAGDMAKLISANDHSGFTYRGRFAKPAEAVQIGYEVSQKAHHALRWLIQRQGIYVDSRYFVTFGVENNKVPEPFDGTAEQFDDFFADELRKLSQQQAITEEIVAEELNNALKGKKYSLNKDNLENIIVMAFDAATKGRLAIVYYQHLKTELFFDAILHWHTTCRWIQSYKDPETNKIKKYVGTPSTFRIAEAVYGSKADIRLKKDLYTRLLPCIVEKKPIPKDIIQIIFNRIKNPFSFNSNGSDSWNTTLNIACALVNKQYESEGYIVALQEENNERDYLFGRLLGIAEVMEQRILKERQDNRATNATRYFNAFSQHPARTWLVIRKQLTPYFERSGHLTGYYAMLLQQVEDKFTSDQMTNEPLNPLFLLGYSSQIQHLYTKKEEAKNDDIKAQN